MGDHRLKGLNVWPYMTSKGGTMMRGNVGTHRSKGFNGWPIVTCDNAIVTAKKARIEGLQCAAYCDLWQWHCYCMGAQIERFQYAADCLVKLGVPWQTCLVSFGPGFIITTFLGPVIPSHCPGGLVVVVVIHSCKGNWKLDLAKLAGGPKSNILVNNWVFPLT